MAFAAAGGLVLALGGAAYAFFRTPAARVCWTMRDLCDPPGARVGPYGDFGACLDSMSELSRVYGDEAIVGAATCVEGAGQCPEGMACITAMLAR
ncbi:MAG: hypothetical protein AAGN82_17590 [Myxococcota bacterium]